MADRSGQQLGNYRLVRLLGEGGFAEVYLGEHLHLETEAAIKILYAQLASDDMEHFRAEARIIARLEHPNIVRVLDFGVEGKVPFLVMSYAPHGTLRQRHKKGVPLPLTTVTAYVKQIADALQYAHNQKVIHRDIKPENMLIGRRDEILLSDFGIALVAQSSRYQNTRDVVGTVAYMAPEQIQGKPRPASDQYALAVVVYEWLSGVRPFTGSFTEIAVQHTVVPQPPLREKLPSISADVEEIVLTALAKDPQQRFVNVQAFANALDQASSPPQITVFPFSRPSPAVSPRTIPDNDATIAATPHYLAEQNISTPSPRLSEQGEAIGAISSAPTPSFISPTSSAAPGISISRRTFFLGLAAIVVAGGTLTWFALSRNVVNPPTPQTIATATPIQTVTQPTPTPTATPIPSPPLGQTFTVYRGHKNYIYGVTWASTDGSRIASASADTSVQEWNASTKQPYFTYNHTKAVNDIKSSHDKTRIASAGEDSIVQVRDATTGSSTLQYTHHTDAVNTVEWSPDSTRIVSASRDRTVQVWDATNGSTITTYSGHTSEVWAAGWSPDGSSIVSVSADGTAQVWDTSTGTLRFIYRGHSATVRSVSWSPDGSRIATASEDLTVQVWNATTGQPLLTYKGHTDLLRTVLWSPDNTRIVSGGRDATAQIWNASTGTLFYTYTGHSATVFDAQWSPDGTRIASGSTDTTVQVWQAV
ncbi:MAG: WD40 repeat domain-containing serine/threonine protein kinase [Ktedonobacteraceae bacterium]